MFNTTFSNELKLKMEKLLPLGYVMTDENMLRVYCEFWIIKNNFIFKWDDSELILNPTKSDPIYFEEVSNDFLSWKFFEFIRYILPSYILNPDTLKSIFLAMGKENEIVEIAKTIIFVKKSQNALSTKKPNKDSKEKLYQDYLNAFPTGKGKAGLSKEDYQNIVAAINVFQLDLESLTKNPFKIEKGALEVASIFNNELRETKNNQLKYCWEIYLKKITNSDISSSYSSAQFCELTTKEAINKKLAIKAQLLKLDPLDVLCAINIDKKSFYDSGHMTKRMTASTCTPNDIVIENSLAFHFFMSSLTPKYRESYSCIVFFPTPYFIKKWSIDEWLKDYSVTFVVDNIWTKELHEMHFKNADYCSFIRNEFNFKTYEEIENKSYSLEEYEYTNAIFFLNNINNDNEKQKFCSFFKSHSPKLKEVYGLSTDEGFKDFMIEDGDVNDILLIPPGIANSTIPKFKTFWHCRKERRLTDYPNIKISAAVLIKDGGYRQQIMLPEENEVLVSSNRFTELDVSLRELYHDLKHDNQLHASNRNKPKVFKFSSEISIWYNESSSKTDPAKMRVEAYICYALSKPKSEDFLQRGNRIKESIKANTNISKEEISKWLKEEYPNASISIRGSENKTKVREVIASEYKTRLKDKNISIRTLWYIYSEILNEISKQEYELLDEMAMGSVGEINLKYSVFQDYIDKLDENYKDEPNSKRLVRLNVLSIIISFAIKYNHCQLNVLDEALLANSISNKGFTEIRSALTKKSFTETELRTIFARINRKIDDGKSEYIGLLIKLLTGLESNIVCALKWEDFVLVEDYGFYKLLVYQQITNDGKEYKEILSIRDFRCVPCSKILADYLAMHMEKIQEKYPDTFKEMSIVVNDSSNNLDGDSISFAPRELEKLSRDMISEMGIEDINISVFSDNEKGTKDTNLSRYIGDMFRSNFKYWALKKAKMTADELQYLLGNKPDTTFGIFYCDYVSDAAQLSLFVKLLRIDANLLNSSSECEQKTFLISDKGNEHTIETEGPLPLSLNIIAKVTNTLNPRIQISNKYGFVIQATKIKS